MGVPRLSPAGRSATLAATVASRPIKLRLDGEEIHLVSRRELDRWGGYINAARAAYTLVTPENVATIRQSLLTPA